MVWIGGLDWWLGLVAWIRGLDRWLGLVVWIGGLGSCFGGVKVQRPGQTHGFNMRPDIRWQVEKDGLTPTLIFMYPGRSSG